MPELPEVETVVRQLRPILADRRITLVNFLDPLFAGLDPQALIGKQVEATERLGKQIVLTLSSSAGDESFLAVHLRMTGRLLWMPVDGTVTEIEAKYVHQSSIERAHLRAEFVLEGGSLLFYDTRRFGTIKYSEKRENFIPTGVDPCSKEFTSSRLCELVKGSNQATKVWLLRQDKVVGLGNIYACEIAFRAKVDPFSPIGLLDKKQLARIHRSTKEILQAAIENCGTTFSDFQDSSGELGEYQNFLKVYNREGEPCSRRGCGTILRQVQQGRSTFYCPKCQGTTST